MSSSALLLALLLAGAASGQGADPATIVFDGSLGEAGEAPSTQVDGIRAYEIPDAVTRVDPGTGEETTEWYGRYAGSNLFHSFSLFDILSGDKATFTATNGTPERVIARVTGGSLSVIDGTFASEIPGADIFFVNPSGITLRDEAHFDVSGSLYLSTAHALRFPEGAEYDFYTGTDAAPLLLSAAAPTAFGFVGESFNNRILLSAARNLGVDPGETLALIGGDPEGSVGGVRIQRSCGTGCATIDASGASLEIASAKGVVDVPVDLQGFDPETVDAGALGEVELIASSTLFAGETDGPSTGRVVIRGGHFVFENSAQVIGPTVDVAMSDDVEIKSGAQMLGGNVSIAARDVSIGTASASGGQVLGGSISINGKSVAVEGVGSGMEVSTDYGSDGGIDIRADALDVGGGGQLVSIAPGAGAGGDIEIRASERVRVSGSGCSAEAGCTPSAIVSRSEADATGNAGMIFVETPVLEVLNGATIETVTLGSGDAGALALVAGTEVLKGVEIRASERVTIEGGADGFSLIGSNTKGAGRAGGLSIAPIQSTDALALELRSGGQVTVSTSGPGDAGSIEIAAHSVEIEGVDPATGKSDSGIFARQNEAGGSGNAGDLNVSAQHLSVSDRGRISVSTRGAGDAGTIALNVGETLTLSGPNLPGKATIEARHDVEGAAGKPGEIRIVAGGEVLLLDGAQITAETRGAERGGDIGIVAHGGVRLSGGSQITAQSQSTGDAGVIDIDAGPQLEVIGSRITTESKASSGGQVIIRADELVYLLHGEIFTKVEQGEEGTGGDILIDPQFVVLNEGRIVADAGEAGKITIAGTLFVSTPFFASPPFSDLVPFAIPLGPDDEIPDRGSVISATSRARSNLNGAINANTPETQLVMELAALPESYLDASALLASACDARTSRAGSFQVQPRVAVLSPPDAAFAPPGRALSAPAVGTGGVDAPACVPQEVLQ
jgi:filamentous hemagglutinin family protein